MKLRWEINGEYTTAQWKSGWFTIRPEDKYFLLTFDSLRLMAYDKLGLYVHRAEAERKAEEIADAYEHR